MDQLQRYCHGYTLYVDPCPFKSRLITCDNCDIATYCSLKCKSRDDTHRLVCRKTQGERVKALIDCNKTECINVSRPLVVLLPGKMLRIYPRMPNLIPNATRSNCAICLITINPINRWLRGLTKQISYDVCEHCRTKRLCINTYEDSDICKKKREKFINIFFWKNCINDDTMILPTDVLIYITLITMRTGCVKCV